MDIQTLQTLVDVSQTGSFAGAAKKKLKDPSVISRTISNLETELGFRLFKRSTRKLSLTEAGARYLSRVAPLLNELDFAKEEAKSLIDTPSGNLKITAPVSFGQRFLIPRLELFLKQYPDIHLELALSDTNVDLIADDIDVACRLAPSFESDLIGHRLFSTNYLVCASPDYLKNHTKIIKPKDLETHRCLVFSLPKYRSRWLFKNTPSELTEVRIQSKMAMSGALALHECALRGIGPALLSDWMVEQDIASGRLVQVLPDYQVTATDFDTAAWLLYPSRKYLPEKTKAFVEFIKRSV